MTHRMVATEARRVSKELESIEPEIRTAYVYRVLQSIWNLGHRDGFESAEVAFGLAEPPVDVMIDDVRFALDVVVGESISDEKWERVKEILREKI